MLLPSGLYDLLPPFARQETEMTQRFLTHFARFGYAQVSPPLLEYEDGLLSGSAAGLAAETFRVVDPLSQRMMGFRPDMTLQVARIALVRLAHLPRPLRLSYAGPTLRMRPEQLQNTRQPLQMGIELIGAANPRADAEVIGIAVDALLASGFESVSVDLNLPGLLTRLLQNDPAAKDKRPEIAAAITAKDISAIGRLELHEASRIMALLRVAGPVAQSLPAVLALLADEDTKPLGHELQQVVEELQGSGLALSLTLDPLESHDFGYHQGIRFSLFVPGVKQEIGRGGRYRIEMPNGDNEAATGCTLYADRLLEALPAPTLEEKIFVPAGTPFSETANWRAEGYATVHGVGTETDAAAEAKRLGCTKLYTQRGLEPL